MLAGALAVVLWYAPPAQAQFSGVWGGEEVQVGQDANLFARWEGRDALDGVFLELPTGWTLREALAARPGYRHQSLSTRRLDGIGNVYAVDVPRRIRGLHDLIFHVETGGMPGRAAWTITPFTLEGNADRARPMPHDAYRFIHPGVQRAPARADDNRVLAFRGRGGPLLLHRAAVPDLGSRADYTVEFWLRTTDLREVVLSTWTGAEHDTYPLELVVDGGGRLRFYRGQPGHHASMTTEGPVADGQWHHVALTHDADAGWTHLFLDGLAADSLYDPAQPLFARRTPLGVGARLPARDTVDDGLRSYTGLLDELRLWPEARPLALLRRTMRQPMRPTPGALLLSFEERIPTALVEQRAPRAERVYSDLVFHLPVTGVRARPEATGVRLTWETADPHTERFIVERSTDGRTFTPVGEVLPTPPERRNLQGHTYSFNDADVADQVVFYRIRQRFESGSERLSGAIKLGLGRPEPEAVLLVGNFPNPFNPTTTITYEVREAQPVNVSVWDLSGQLVAVLVDRLQQPGDYRVPFEARDLPSGTYFVRLRTPEGTQTHKMILMK